MRKGHDNGGREGTIYESFAEVEEIAHKPPRFCEIDGTELRYFSFYDSLNRFTLKAYCKTCKKYEAITVKKEKYEEKMLSRWREMVIERDGHRCRMANKDCKGPLHAHHIVPKGADPNQKFNVENGMCLCEAHHKMIHKFM